MNAPTSAAAARKPLAVKSELEAEISDLLDPEGQKLPAQIEDDGERIRSLVARLTSNSIDELEGLGSDLTSAVRQLQEFLKSEGAASAAGLGAGECAAARRALRSG
jgi:hypothetical protein